MRLLQQIARVSYRGIRRLGILDITRLMYLATDSSDLPIISEGYEIRAVPAAELRDLIALGLVHENVGCPSQLDDGHRAVVAAYWGDRVVSFVWFASQFIDAEENYSRAAHLGTSIDLPDGSAFLYNAWTDPEHRGKRLIASILAYALRHRVAGGWSLLTSIDWTNQQSIRAFERVGMVAVGTVVRCGRGPLQLSFIPHAAERLGVRMAEDAPGMKFAL